ncbi:MAG: EamA family transporter RarD [Anaerolineaceae bacterium]|nr:EamA family transporter RarD [Anaerolineaceae bacterium]
MNKGISSGIAAYFIWGFFPIYFKLLHDVQALQIVAHRLVWSLVFLSIIIVVRKDWAGLKAGLKPRTLLITLLAGCLLSVNWLIYVWGVNSGFILEASLGYFINPLVNVLLGVIFLRERLPLSKWIPVGLAATGVLYLTLSYGRLPWIALALAFTFGLYGLIKKLSPLNSLDGLTLETAILFIPSLGYLLIVETQGTGAIGHMGLPITGLLAVSGVVTAIPLLLFATAARNIPLSTLGLLQYIAPTLQFFIGVWIYNEEFTHERMIGFGIIWLALLLFSLNGLYQRRKTLSAPSIEVSS